MTILFFLLLYLVVCVQKLLQELYSMAGSFRIIRRYGWVWASWWCQLSDSWWHELESVRAPGSFIQTDLPGTLFATFLSQNHASWCSLPRNKRRMNRNFTNLNTLLNQVNWAPCSALSPKLECCFSTPAGSSWAPIFSPQLKHSFVLTLWFCSVKSCPTENSKFILFYINYAYFFDFLEISPTQRKRETRSIVNVFSLLYNWVKSAARLGSEFQKLKTPHYRRLFVRHNWKRQITKSQTILSPMLMHLVAITIELPHFSTVFLFKLESRRNQERTLAQNIIFWVLM